MNEMTVVLSSFSVLLLVALVMQIVYWMKMQRQQIERLIEENQRYKRLFFQMLDNRLNRLESKRRAK